MGEGQEKYYFWGFGMLMFVPILQQLNACKSTCPAATSATYNKIANLTIITWIFYPIVWLMAEGNNSLAPDKEALAYTTLDILAKSVFGFIIISARNAAAPAPAAAAPCRRNKLNTAKRSSEPRLLWIGNVRLTAI